MMISWQLHTKLIVATMAFLILSIVFGGWLAVYDMVWWWDDMLHAMSGVLFAFIGLYVLQVLEGKSVLRASPAVIALFAFCFAVTAGVVWEIFEFVMDFAFGFAMQQWDMPPSAIVMGVSNQGMGLRDTMSDLILASAGSAITSLGIYAHNRNKTRR